MSFLFKLFNREAWELDQMSDKPTLTGTPPPTRPISLDYERWLRSPNCSCGCYDPKTGAYYFSDAATLAQAEANKAKAAADEATTKLLRQEVEQFNAELSRPLSGVGMSVGYNGHYAIASAIYNGLRLIACAMFFRKK